MIFLELFVFLLFKQEIRLNFKIRIQPETKWHYFVDP